MRSLNDVEPEDLTGNLEHHVAKQQEVRNGGDGLQVLNHRQSQGGNRSGVGRLSGPRFCSFGIGSVSVRSGSEVSRGRRLSGGIIQPHHFTRRVREETTRVKGVSTSLRWLPRLRNFPAPVCLSEAPREPAPPTRTGQKGVASEAEVCYTDVQVIAACDLPPVL